jgi:hypothetical protein
MEVTYIDGVAKKMSWEEFCKEHPGSEKHFSKVKDALFEFGIYHGGGNGKEHYTLISSRLELAPPNVHKLIEKF